MPSKSKKQARLMAACAHGAKYKACPPKKVAKEYNKADKKKGTLKQGVNSPKTRHGKLDLPNSAKRPRRKKFI